MKALLLYALITSMTFAVGNGDKAPEFSLQGHPKMEKLSDHRGQFVVLEWYNDGCPFVRKHYDSNNMQALQKKYGQKVHWLTINSSAKNKQGYLASADAAKAKYTQEQMKAMGLLIDSSGDVGQAYGAKTTPHMFVIDPKGKVVYQGAIDSKPSADAGDIPSSTNYVAQALDEAMAGKKVNMAKTKPYGCSVKY